MSVTQWLQSQAANFYDTGYKNWSHDMTNVSLPEVDMMKNSSTLAVSVPINLSIKLVFVSVNKASAVMYSMSSREYDVAGATSTPPSLNAFIYRAY